MIRHLCGIHQVQGGEERKGGREEGGRKEEREDGSKLEEAALQSRDHCEEMFKQEDWT